MLRARLEEAECEAMDEIMGMVGLRQVKQTALSLFEILLANRALVEQGHHKAATPMTLNFVFLGNPGCVRLGSYDFLAATTFLHGTAFSWRASPFVLVMFLLMPYARTGKTTVARHFSRLLYQTGARAGYKFLQMTAGEALRIGSKKFAQRLESLTGGPKDVGPPPDSRPFRRGLHVEVRDPHHGPGDKAASWYVDRRGDKCMFDEACSNGCKLRNPSRCPFQESALPR